MTIEQLKKELSLSNKDIAEFFGMKMIVYANSSAKERYENALCKFYEYVKDYQKKQSIEFHQNIN